jgi:hypothetical protein
LFQGARGSVPMPGTWICSGLIPASIFQLACLYIADLASAAEGSNLANAVCS